jgi:hypothetical protein
MTPYMGHKGRCVGFGEREDYRQFDHGMAY